jgi:hypothetical protein
MPELNVTSGTVSGTVLGQVIGGDSWGGTVLYTGLFIIIPLAVIGIGLSVLWNIANYTRFKKYLAMFGMSLQYAMTGVATLLVVSIPCSLLYYMYNQARSGNVVPIWVSFAIVGIYILLALIGWFVQKKVIDRVMMFEKKLKGGKK